MFDEPPVQGGCQFSIQPWSDDAHPALRERAQLMDAWRILLQRIVDKGIMRGELHSTVDADTVATILIATIEGAVLSKLWRCFSFGTGIEFSQTYVQHQLAAPV